MVPGFIARPNGFETGTVILAACGLFAAGGAYTFVYNLWRTIDGPRAGVVATRTSLPLAG